MRAYSFTNYYLSTIAQGIQPAHAINDLHIKYADESPQRAVLLDWSKNHKTMICLSGGDYHGVLDCFTKLEAIAPALQLPYGAFHEDESSLGGLMTSCVIIVPEWIYELAAEIRAARPIERVAMLDAIMQPEAAQLIELLNNSGLAR